ncbi:MAG: hypothetical protein NT062_09135 [Proteobacteria bacterium]|nr:hypothetical protein [Pseudomonadota bacterium]
MTFWRCVVLSLIVACGASAKPVSVDPPKDVVAPPRPAPATPVALAIVVEGHEMWIGNDQTDVSEEERYLGALKPLEETFAKLSTAGLPAGSTATVVTYGEHASVRHPMAPISTLTAAAFGEQRDYRGVIDRDLVGGVTLGLDELAKARGSRHVLVVIGDGTDTNVDTAKATLTTLAKRAAAEHVQVVSFVYKGPLSSSGNPLAAFDPNMLTVNSIGAIGPELETLFGELIPKPVVAHSGNAVAIALLVSGAETWMGNDDLEPADDPARYTGALKAIRAALEKTPMTGFPAGSQGAILTYEDTVKTRQRMGPIEAIDAPAMGDQKAYYKTAGSELASGVRAAIGQLANVDSGRKVLIILGDGNDTNNEVAKAQLRDLAKKASALHIEVRAIIWKSALSDEQDVIHELDPTVSTAKTSDELTTQLAAVLKAVR